MAQLSNVNDSERGRGTTDGLFTLRQFVEKKLEKQGSMCIGFVDLEKAFDTVPREMVMTTLRWLGVPEADRGQDGGGNI